MKTAIFSTAALSLLTLAAAQPRGHRQHKHAHNEEKRDLKIVTQVDWVTMIAPEVIVYVDQFGRPMFTSQAGQAPATTSSSASSSSSSIAPVVVATSSTAPVVVAASSVAAVISSVVNVVIPPSSTPVVVVAPSSTPVVVASSSAAPVVVSVAPSSSVVKATSAAPVPSSATSSAPAASSSAASTGGNAGYSITYSPYNADGTCKTQAQVNSDFTKISGYSMVRIYGSDCNQVVTVGSAAKAGGMKLFAGIWDITKVASEVATIVAATGGDFSNFHTISVGNEIINSGTGSVADVVAAIGTARTLLKAAGYTGKIVTVDTAGALIGNPALCQASDYAAANAHAFFSSTTSADQAGAFVLSQAQAVSKACGGMTTIITETGWPSQGSANGAAVPSLANQQTAIAAIRKSLTSNVILFNAFNDGWKKDNAYTFGAEKYWGIYGTSTA